MIGCAAALVLASALLEAASRRPAARSGDSYRETVERVTRRAPDTTQWSSIRRDAYERGRRQNVGRPIAVLQVPRLRLEVLVLPKDDDPSLDRAVSHIAGTALPGEHGNVGIAGHRDGYFRPLEHALRGDVVRLVTPSGIRDYRVAETRIVDPAAVEVLAPTKRDALTLVTCYPFYYPGHAPQRFTLRAYASRASEP